jgi:hypothetical protein
MSWMKRYANDIAAAARAAGYSLGPLYHGIRGASARVEPQGVSWDCPYSVLDVSVGIEPGAWFSRHSEVASKYGAPVPFFLACTDAVRVEGPLSEPPGGADAVYRMRGRGDGIESAWEVAIFDPRQAKLATITYDDAGDPVPLELRFDPSNPDMRY